MSVLLPRVRAQISKTALHHNLTLLANHAQVPLLLPIKANAYGHGLEIVARYAAKHPQVWGLAVAVPSEAEQVARFNLAKPILLLTPPMPTEVEYLAQLGIRLPVASLAQARALPATAKAHLKIDTGMNRLGAHLKEAVQIGQFLASRGQLEGVYTHFASSDEPDLSFAYQQLEQLGQVLSQLPPVLAHAANGAGILSLGQIPNMQLARAGLAAYGFAPAHLRHILDLKPVMSIEAQVTHIHTAQRGETVSYGRLWQATKPTTLATIGMGYADGYPRNATGKAQVLVQGHNRPITGRICMDQFMVDITDLEVNVGDWIQICSSKGPSITDLADWGDMIEYEVLTGIGERVKRVPVE